MSKNKIEKVVFLGSKKLGIEILKCLFDASPLLSWTVIHPNDESDNRNCLNEFQTFCQEKELDLQVVDSQSTANEIIDGLRPDIAVVCGWYWLLRKKVLDVVEHGFWGIHNSLLPKFRGGAPLVWSMINGDKYVGSSFFKLSEGMDDGPILHQVKVELQADHTVSDVLSIIEKSFIDDLPEKWEELLQFREKPIFQDEEDATYCGQRIEADGHINWSASASVVHNFIRAQSPPYPGAFAYLSDAKISMLSSRVVNGHFFGTAGQVIRVKKPSVTICCGGQTAIELVSVGVDGEVKDAASVLNSIRHRLR
jgi:methionyl-tRNA formyltransferase